MKLKGLYATIEGGIYYFNISQKFSQCLSETINESRIYKTFYINEQIFLTVSDNNKVSFWNIDTAELLHSYNFKAQLMAPFYDRESNKLICHFENNNEVHVLSISKLGILDSYINEELVASQRKSDDYVIKMFTLEMEKKQYYVLTKKGNLFDYSYTEKEYSILYEKVNIKYFFCLYLYIIDWRNSRCLHQ